MRKSAYNPQIDDEPNQKSVLNCPAPDCPMLASQFHDGGPWACRYHAKRPTHIWPQITELLSNNLRRLNLIKIADALTPDEFDAMQRKRNFALDELIAPVVGEAHRQWVLRIKDTVYKALQHEINKIEVDNETASATAKINGISWATRMLTSGAMLKNGSTKKQEAA